MAKNKVEVDVIVDDKGTTKKLGLESKKAAQGLDQTGKSARTADRNLKGASQQSANGTKNFSKMAQGMQGGLIPAYATFAASVFALTAVFQGLKNAADFRVVKDAQIAFSSATGVGMMTLTSQIKSATDGLVGFKEASQAAAIGTASGLGVEQIKSLAKGAREVSLILGRDVTDSFNRLIRGVTKAEPELLDELGITLRLKDATENYAASIGKAATQLSLYERSQAVAAEVQDQLDRKYASVAASVELQSNAIAQLGVAFEKVIQPIQRFGAAIAEPVAQFLAKNITALSGVFALLAIPIVKAAIPALDGWRDKSIQSSAASKKAYQEAREEIERLTLAQKQLKLQGADPGAAAQAALRGQKGLKGGALKIQSGDFTGLSKRELSGLLTQAEKGRGIIAKLPKDMKTQYLAALREMKNGTKTTMAGISATIQNMSDRAILQFKKIKTAWAATMAGMKRMASLASRFINKVMKLAGLIGILLLVKDVVVGIGQSMGFGKQSEEAAKLGAELETLNGTLEQTAKQFSKFVEIQEKYYAKNLGDGISPTLEGLGQAGSFVDSNAVSMLNALDTIGKYRSALDEVENKQQEARTAADTRIKAVEDQFTQIRKNNEALAKSLNKSVEDLTAQDRQYSYGFGQLFSTKALHDELKVAREARDELLKIQDDIKTSLDPSFMEKFGLGFVDVGAEAEKATKNVQKLAGQMVAGLRAGRIETQAGGARFIELAGILRDTGTLSEGLRAEFEQLKDQLVGLGAEARLARQEMGELDKLFSNKITGITGFSTSVTDLISRTEKMRQLFSKTEGFHFVDQKQADGTFKEVKKKGGKLQDTEGASKFEKDAGERLKVLNKIREKEIGLQLRKLGIQAQVNTLMVGATDLMKEEIKLGQQLANIESQKIGLLNDLALIRDSDLVADKAKAQELMLQLQLLYQQEGQLRRNADIALSILDDMTNAFQNSFSSGLADIIKGKESSFSDMIGKAAIKGLEAAADNLAKNMTKSIFGIKDESPEEKIKTGMMSAADYHAGAILNAIKGSDTTPSIIPKGTGPSNTITGKDVPIKLPGSGVKGVGEGTTTNKDGATVKIDGDSFTTKLDGIMGSNAPFIDKLGNTFDLSIGKLGSGLSAGFGELFAGLKGIGGGLLSIFGFASGGIASPGKKFAGYSDGGIASGSRQGYPAVLHGTEAVVPLPNGKSIPVEMAGSGSTQNNVTVNVSTEGSVQTESSDGSDSEALGKAVAAAVKEELQNQKRSGGILNPYGVA